MELLAGYGSSSARPATNRFVINPAAFGVVTMATIAEPLPAMEPNAHST